MSILGITIAQISRIQSVLEPDHQDTLHFHVSGKPQACICQAVAGLILLTGTYRFFCHQNAITLGQARFGGWGLFLVGVLVGLCLFTFFLLILLLDAAEASS